MMEDPWAQAFSLMADHGQPAACRIVVDGIKDAVSVEEGRQWHAIADCLNTVAMSSQTKH